ncbi:hypothetical protein MKC87_23200, partial [[Clostridium] innocuum]|nr:hypothetical protein [[Clostridium] innocuum]
RHPHYSKLLIVTVLHNNAYLSSCAVLPLSTVSVATLHFLHTAIGGAVKELQAGWRFSVGKYDPVID